MRASPRTAFPIKPLSGAPARSMKGGLVRLSIPHLTEVNVKANNARWPAAGVAEVAISLLRLLQRCAQSGWFRGRPQILLKCLIPISILRPTSSALSMSDPRVVGALADSVAANHACDTLHTRSSCLYHRNWNQRALKWRPRLLPADGRPGCRQLLFLTREPRHLGFCTDVICAETGSAPTFSRSRGLIVTPSLVVITDALRQSRVKGQPHYPMATGHWIVGARFDKRQLTSRQNFTRAVNRALIGAPGVMLLLLCASEKYSSSSRFSMLT